MGKSLEQVKTDLSDEYLGKKGIHGIGYRLSKNAIVVYIEKTDSENRSELHEQLKNEAAPFQVILIEEEPPKIS